MANPFGSGDETLSKNTGHTNQANLIRALVPRSSSKVVEVISDTAQTGLSSGSYDADGYFAGTDTTRRDAFYTLPANLNPTGSYTVIAGVKYNSSGGSSGGYCYTGMVDMIGGVGQLRIAFDNYNRRAVTSIYDSNSTTAGSNGTWQSPGADVFYAIAQCSTSAQKGYSYAGGTMYPSTPGVTSTTSMGGSAVCNSLRFTYTTQWAFQFVFLYDAILSETDMNAIMANPGDVLSYAAASGSSKSTKFFLMGIG